MNRRGGRLFWKYAVVIVAVVSGALLTSGFVQLYFSYQENQAALVQLQQEKAVTAAARIEQFVAEIRDQVGGAVSAPLGPGAVTLDQRQIDYLRLLRQAPAVTEISFLNATGQECLRVSRLAMNTTGCQADLSRDPRFLAARSGQTYFSPVYFRNESEPYMTMAVAESGPEAGVTVAEVNLKLIWDVVSQIRFGRAGHAYVVDSLGHLIAHPDISLVLQRTDLSGLPQVRAASAGGRGAYGIARDLPGRQVLTAFQTISPPGWTVFVEQPLDEAFAPVYASVLRTAVLLLAGLALSIVASLALARRMVTPIQALQVGAARVGAGALDQRIVVRTGDELEALAGAFNQMTARLSESYAGLEQKVEARTRELAQSVAELTALGEVSQTINSTLDLQAVLTTIVTRAAELSGTDAGAIYEFDEATQVFELRATHGMTGELIAAIHEARPSLRDPLIGRAAVERRALQVADLRQGLVSPLGPLLERAGFLALLCIPLLRDEQIVGALIVRRRAPGSFADATVRLLETFAAQSVLAIQNARLYQELENQSHQLETANRHKSEFLASMSHELRTPLNAIIGFSEVLLERLFGELNEKQDEYLHDILTSGQHLLSLINDILDLSKVEAGRMDLERARFSLPEALETSLMMVRERAANHGIALALDVAPEVGLVEADERRVKQVIFNLLSNAVKFTPDGGRVEVTARLAAHAVEVAVRDTGVGIAPEDQERIFEEFRQARHGALQKREGTGLGLALSRRFVELHGGRIWVESALGAGSTFTFTLPLAADLSPGPSPLGEGNEMAAVAEDAAPSSTSPLPSPAEAGPRRRVNARSAEGRALGGGRSILLVEDDPRAVDLLTLYLAGAGFEVAVAHDGEEGLAMARRLQPAAITLDIRLPRLDGWDFLAAAKADPDIAAVPVVIVSMVEERGKGFALGAADYLVKPVGRDALLAALRRLVRPAPVLNGRAKVLVVDDDPLALALVQAVLTPAGYTVLSATGGEEGLVAARRERPALVILDLLMPGVDGFAVVERLRADPVTSDIPIVVLTAKTMSLEEKARLNGHISHLASKGEFDGAAFIALVRGLCPVPAA